MSRDQNERNALQSDRARQVIPSLMSHGRASPMAAKGNVRLSGNLNVARSMALRRARVNTRIAVQTSQLVGLSLVAEADQSIAMKRSRNAAAETAMPVADAAACLAPEDPNFAAVVRYRALPRARTAFRAPDPAVGTAVCRASPLIQDIAINPSALRNRDLLAPIAVAPPVDLPITIMSAKLAAPVPVAANGFAGFDIVK